RAFGLHGGIRRDHDTLAFAHQEEVFGGDGESTHTILKSATTKASVSSLSSAPTAMCFAITVPAKGATTSYRVRGACTRPASCCTYASAKPRARSFCVATWSSIRTSARACFALR